MTKPNKHEQEVENGLIDDEILYSVEVDKKIAGDPRYNYRNVKIRIEATSGHNYKELAERLGQHLDLATDYTVAYLEELEDQ